MVNLGDNLLYCCSMSTPLCFSFFWCNKEMISSTFGIRVHLGGWTKGACSITEKDTTAWGMGITTKWHQICSAGVRPTFCTEPEPNVRLSSMENSSGSRTVLLSLTFTTKTFRVSVMKVTLFFAFSQIGALEWQFVIFGLWGRYKTKYSEDETNKVTVISET